MWANSTHEIGVVTITHPLLGVFSETESLDGGEHVSSFLNLTIYTYCNTNLCLHECCAGIWIG
jgi:hypothetical protein